MLRKLGDYYSKDYGFSPASGLAGPELPSVFKDVTELLASSANTAVPTASVTLRNFSPELHKKLPDRHLRHFPKTLRPDAQWAISSLLAHFQGPETGLNLYTLFSSDYFQHRFSTPDGVQRFLALLSLSEKNPTIQALWRRVVDLVKKQFTDLDAILAQVELNCHIVSEYPQACASGGTGLPIVDGVSPLACLMREERRFDLWDPETQTLHVTRYRIVGRGISMRGRPELADEIGAMKKWLREHPGARLQVHLERNWGRPYLMALASTLSEFGDRAAVAIHDPMQPETPMVNVAANKLGDYLHDQDLFDPQYYELYSHFDEAMTEEIETKAVALETLYSRLLQGQNRAEFFLESKQSQRLIDRAVIPLYEASVSPRLQHLLLPLFQKLSRSWRAGARIRLLTNSADPVQQVHEYRYWIAAVVNHMKYPNPFTLEDLVLATNELIRSAEEVTAMRIPSGTHFDLALS